MLPPKQDVLLVTKNSYKVRFLIFLMRYCLAMKSKFNILIHCQRNVNIDAVCQNALCDGKKYTGPSRRRRCYVKIFNEKAMLHIRNRLTKPNTLASEVKYIFISHQSYFMFTPSIHTVCRHYTSGKLVITTKWHYYITISCFTLCGIFSLSG